MDAIRQLRDLRNRIYDDYLADPDSEVRYIRRLTVWATPRLALGGTCEPAESSAGIDPIDPPEHANESPGDDALPEPKLLVLRRRPSLEGISSTDPKARSAHTDPVPAELDGSPDDGRDVEPEAVWGRLLDRLEIGPEASIRRIDQRSFSAPEYLIYRAHHEMAANRFRTHLLILGRFLTNCRCTPDSVALPPPRFLDFCLHYASLAPHDSWLGAECFHVPRGRDTQSQRIDRRWEPEALEAHGRGALAWPEGHYFFVLEGDARLCAVHCIDRFLAHREEAASADRSRSPIPLLALCRIPESNPWQCPVASGQGGNDSCLKPRWVRTERKLYYGQTCCREYARKARQQFRLLDAFEETGWPDLLNDPFKFDQTLRQTIDDLNHGLRDGPLRFRVVSHRANWYVESRDAGA